VAYLNPYRHARFQTNPCPVCSDSVGRQPRRPKSPRRLNLSFTAEARSTPQSPIFHFSVHTKPVFPMIKQYSFALLTVFVAMFAIPALRAQSNCYVRLTDASGYTPAAEQIAALEQAAAALCLAFDSSGFSGQFKVYDFGFYLHHETTAGGYPEPFARKVEAVAALSPYYLVFGKQSDRSGVYTRFWVEARLPDSLSFSCLDTIGAGILRTSFDLTANIEYEALGKMPSNYHLAEIRVMNKLKAEVDKLRECCYNQQRGLSSCDAPCLTPDETKKLLEQLGFTAIPIKILGPAQARGADGQRPVYNRVTDCAELDIEMDGVEYHDFAGTINNIMSVYQDSTVRAEILDEGCLCAGGIEYLKGKMGNDTIVLIILISEMPYSPGFHTKHFFQKYPKKLGTLPFKGHFPNKLGISLDTNYIKNTITNIYQKNGFSLTSISFDEPVDLDFFDNFNKIIYDSSDFGGLTWVDHVSMLSRKSNFVNYSKVKDKQDPNQRGYIMGVFCAHESFHQILQKSLLYIKKFTKKEMYDPTTYHSGHCRNARNLMFPGDGLDGIDATNIDKQDIKWSNKERIQIENFVKYPALSTTGILYFSGAFFPKENALHFNDWERISPKFKYFFSVYLLVYDIEKKYGVTSNEFFCMIEILKNHKSLIANKYEME
jgi:hypothetical protein